MTCPICHARRRLEQLRALSIPSDVFNPYAYKLGFAESALELIAGMIAQPCDRHTPGRVLREPQRDT